MSGMSERALALEVNKPTKARAITEATPAPAPASDAASLMAVISRAASDPATDVDKLERLLGMFERIKAGTAEQAYHEAMAAAQAEMRPIAADASNPQTKSKYASFAALDRVLRPIYTKHGFSLSFDTGDGAPADYVRVVCKVSHREGHTERPRIDMPADGKGAKGGDVMTKTHATGAAMTYGQRYLLKMIFNIAVGDDNDKGWGPDVQLITPAQATNLNDLLEEAGADKRRFCEYWNIDSIPALPASDYARSVAMIKQKRAAAAEGAKQ